MPLPACQPERWRASLLEATLKRLFLMALLLPAALAAPCTLTMIPADVRGATYKAKFIVSPSCPAATHFRVRKSSTTSLKRDGAPYQPIKPLLGAWTVTKASATIPAAELWSLATWRWEWWDGTRWQPIRSQP